MTEDRAEEQTQEQAQDPRPLSRLAERFRIPIGVLVTLIGLGLAAVFVTTPIETDLGTRGVVTHVAVVALWVCVAAAGATFAAGLPRRVTNICAAAGIAAYGVSWVAGL